MPQPPDGPPRAEPRPRVLERYGERLEDEFHWLRERDDPAVLRYLEAENEHAASTLAELAGTTEALYEEMLARIKQTDLTVPYREGRFWYYTRTVEGEQYPIHCRKRDSLEGAEQVLLDLNHLARGHSHMKLGAFEVSPSGRYLAYSTDPTGFREYRLVVVDLDTGEQVAGPIEHAGSVAWALDDATFFYTVEDEAKRDYRVYRQRLGASAELVFEEPDERFRVYVGATRSLRFVILHVASHTTSEVRFLQANAPEAPWRMVSPREAGREYYLGDLGDRFLIRVNDTGRNFRLVTAGHDDATAWEELEPHRDDVMIEHVDCFATHRVAWERRDGLPLVRITAAGSGESDLLDLPEQVYEVHPGMNAEFGARTFRLVYESFVTPASVYDVDLVTRERTLLKRKEVLGGYDPSRYVSERLQATAPDGTRVPVSLVRPAASDPAVPHPLHLTAYGAYGLPYPVTFDSNRVSLLDRGVSFAIAHVRGGGELGKRWHDAGRLGRKMNTFTDLLAAIDLLVASGRTTSDWLTMEGGSAGGLLVGAALNLRSDCCRAAVLQVPFVDVINTMSDSTLPLTVGEYEEWGNPALEEQYRWLRAYCPYTNLEPRPYPALLVRTALNDSQVMFWEPAKYVARMRALRSDDRPLVLLTNLGAGHAGASGRYDRLREVAVEYGFILWQLGLAGQPAG